MLVFYGVIWWFLEFGFNEELFDLYWDFCLLSDVLVWWVVVCCLRVCLGVGLDVDVVVFVGIFFMDKCSFVVVCGLFGVMLCFLKVFFFCFFIVCVDGLVVDS